MLLALVVAVVGCDSSKANQQAAQHTQSSVSLRLERWAAEQPDQAPAVRQLLDGWNSRSERANYERAQPLLKAFAQAHPEEADAIARVNRTWLARLERFGP